MKKILAMMLTAAMMLSMSAAVSAQSANAGKDEGFTDEATVTFTKTYKASGVAPVSPEETFEFENIAFVSAEETGEGYTEAWATSNLPSISTVKFEESAATAEGATGTFTVTLPVNYPSVGIYTYSFNEKDNGYEGVTYNTTPMKLVVTVVQDNANTNKYRVAAVHCEGLEGTESTKVDKFENNYEAGKLTVTKTVTGNLGDQNKEFAIKVTFTASEGDKVYSNITYTDVDDNVEKTLEGTGWTENYIEFTLNHGESININNIPSGVTYKVEEIDAAAKATVIKNEDGSTSSVEAEYKVSYDANQNGTITNEAVATTVTNNKGTNVDTGISVDSIPYIAMLGVVAIGGAGVVVSKKRRSED